jgi:hypothetical protein
MTMLLKRAFLAILLALPLSASTGCGGVKTGVATGKDDPEPKLTKTEIQGEKEIMKEQRQQGD